MFKVDPNPTFTHTVKVKVPVDGGFREETLKATYSVVPASELEGFDLDESQSSQAFLTRTVIGLDDIVDAEGNPLSFNHAVRDALFDLPYVRIALARVYFEGVAGARAGN
ncbi:hypothetical protein [Sphingobium cloacae]|uniref:Uncharacterized protein n=1 Tax=Sphingobium cloacae TaxID=120107 RepID=A0A1E1F2M1_9SPHN|nr:hypothetical protein [Sphingobium cloacae]BAV64764.1 hypothetical protein SCLO_1017240 [Sphingobium cloacae]